jgi:hypothetical protein
MPLKLIEHENGLSTDMKAVQPGAPLTPFSAMDYGRTGTAWMKINATHTDPRL